ncbi:Putative tRNA (cytidine(34)-2'-O)-methyltransferase [Jannaschia seosinensis]|uniref:tRNA (cytidine(34)-2'-O)-methyltransferase n=1 Tax=Jannaschia seosinensis TaxID=313367 RepID=A0A0M7B839_9RHOB|nr:TrmH family RNA methyltransferase [Jannaschia seosinensis]CUH12646.1 Putative tRNA (cytidine(34)-2'-O)-methyltransferase [Jannaschia seosinensis]
MTRPAIVLVQPEIAGNTGSVGRTCVALDLDLCLVRPYGFEITDRNVRRAGLDYWKHVRLHEYDDWADFLTRRAPRPEALFPFEEYGSQSAYDVAFPPDFHLVFGRETVGLGPEVLEGRSGGIVRLPMRSPHIRSLNLANAATAAAYLALRGAL